MIDMKVEGIRYRYCPECGKPYSFPVHGRDNAWEVSAVNENQYRVRCFHCGFVTPIRQHDIIFCPIPDRLAELREKYGGNPEIPYVRATGGMYPEIGYVLTAVDDINELLDMLDQASKTQELSDIVIRWQKQFLVEVPFYIVKDGKIVGEMDRDSKMIQDWGKLKAESEAHDNAMFWSPESEDTESDHGQ